MKKIILTIVLGLLFLSTINAQEFGIQKGEKFPVSALETLEGGKLDIDSISNKILVVNWWFTTCKPCIMEIPGLNLLVKRYKKNPNIEFIAIAFANKTDVANFLLKHQFDYTQTLGFKNDYVKIFGNIFPSNLIIDRKGNVFYQSSGGNENIYMEIADNIEKLLNL